MNGSSVEQRTVVVTGGTSGLGLVTARLLAATPGWTVAIGGRDPARTAAAADRTQAVALPLDLADLASVRAFPRALDAARLPPLGAIVANAGAQFSDRRRTSAEGYEATFATNHLGHHLLLRLLLSDLAPDGRVVIVASGTHRAARVRNFGFPPPAWEHPRALAHPGPGSGQVAYATSKLANLMTMYELRRRLPSLRPHSAIAVHGYDPGLMPATGLARDYPAVLRWAYRRLAPLVTLLPGASATTAAAARLARMVTHPEFAGTRGRYVALQRDATPSRLARDAALASELWDVSAELAPLRERPR